MIATGEMAPTGSVSTDRIDEYESSGTRETGRSRSCGATGSVDAELIWDISSFALSDCTTLSSTITTGSGSESDLGGRAAIGSVCSASIEDISSSRDSVLVEWSATEIIGTGSGSGGAAAMGRVCSEKIVETSRCGVSVFVAWSAKDRTGSGSGSGRVTATGTVCSEKTVETTIWGAYTCSGSGSRAMRGSVD
jgi:hypothetical protein